MKKSFLFYLVHPAKFHFHKVQINELIIRGHNVDIIINTKDILEELVIEEGWTYTNIFPKSRKIKGVHVYIAAFINLFVTVYRLWKFTRGKKYDLFIGDFLTILGRIKRIPSMYPTDDVLAAVPEQVAWFIPAHYIIAPVITDIGKYKIKKIAYKGYKALAHLHPNHFKPNVNTLSYDLQNNEPFFVIRCTGFFATHDINKKGIDDSMLYELEKLLSPYGKILITSERKLPKDLEKYNLNIRKSDMTHYIAFAKIFIGDSTTMCTEAAVLGTPSVEFDEYFYEIEQMIELEKKYGLINCFRTNQSEEFLDKIQEMVNTDNLQEVYNDRRSRYLNETIDVSAFLIWLYENYPKSKNAFFLDQNIQDKFK
ncbi:MAG: hypothetical protein P8I80_02920 [Bacteroidales bacterium]|jgi:uncharacterized protein|nr:hypothetical protein [Bacteroidales bacterium]